MRLACCITALRLPLLLIVVSCDRPPPPSPLDASDFAQPKKGAAPSVSRRESAEPSAPAATAAAGAEPKGARAELSECVPGYVPPLAGQVFHFCDCGPGAASDCRPGDDNQGFGGSAAPWRSYDKARQHFGKIGPGDTVAFCRGGSFTVQNEARWLNTSCRKDQRCVIRDYQPSWAKGDLPLPLITAKESAFRFEDGGDADHDEGYIVLNLKLRGSGAGPGLFFYNDVDDASVCKLEIENFQFGVYVSGSNPAAAGSDGKNARIVLRHSRITGNRGQGWLGSCDGCAIEYSRFENNGFGRPILDHNIYFDGEGRNIRAVGNELYRSAMHEGKCQGVSLVVHGKQDGVLIENNVVREDLGAAAETCWGIAVDTGYHGVPELFHDVTIRGNTVINVGNVAIGLNGCTKCLVENNVVIAEQPFRATGIAAPDRKRDNLDLPMTHVTVRNNSVYLGERAFGGGILLGGEGTRHTLVSNAVLYAGSGQFACFELGLARTAYAAVDNNLCHAGSASWEAKGGDLQTWAAQSAPWDRASKAAPPRFKALTAPNYDLSPDSKESALVDAGHPTKSAPTAFGGAKRDSKPDIGAYEFRR
jgi:hypothetical protein